MSYFKLKSALWILVVLLVGCKQQAQDVQTGFAFDCAKHGKHVSCWGIWSPEAFNNHVDPPIISFQTKNEYVDPKISVGAHHYCVLDQGQVECFLNNEFGQTDVPELSNPYEIAVGGTHSCALDDTGVVFWGEDSNLPYDFPDSFSNPTDISLGMHDGKICVNSDAGVQCWSNDYPVPWYL